MRRLPQRPYLLAANNPIRLLVAKIVTKSSAQ
jgi:hypothetical protein